MLAAVGRWGSFANTARSKTAETERKEKEMFDALPFRSVVWIICPSAAERFDLCRLDFRFW
jgi:hypothetical protein